MPLYLKRIIWGLNKPSLWKKIKIHQQAENNFLKNTNRISLTKKGTDEYLGYSDYLIHVSNAS